MTDENRNADALDRERELREEERKIAEKDPAERSPDADDSGESHAAPPGQVQQPRG